ncbi:MAG: bifunctional 2-C-methyl-D-erythritol 4-phosphate cytidylyltransferase/2-C-methyl-D-erythritol 2,4-cyclodiphosphate synthase [Hyphomicrobiaceae bacterium]
MNVAVIVAAGRGSRAASASTSMPKQYVKLLGKPVLARTLSVFLGHPKIHEVVVVIHPDDEDLYQDVIPSRHTKLRTPVHGGTTRQASVLRGLEAFECLSPEYVVIHDAARPFVTETVITQSLIAAEKTGGAIVALPVTDTLKRASADNTILATIDRSGLWRAATPQTFRFSSILAAHRAAAQSGQFGFTDDAGIAEADAQSVSLVMGDSSNIKITTPADFAFAERLASQNLQVRCGSGYDVHRFVEGDAVLLCGVSIPHSQRLDGHSDADVAMHALTDAILGAIGDGDIGQHFPPNDQQWKGARSDVFLRDAARRVANRGGVISNVDVTIICELPKIGPYRSKMQQHLADVLEIDIGRVSIKATTSEGLGFTGRCEGIAAMASATVLA